MYEIIKERINLFLLYMYVLTYETRLGIRHFSQNQVINSRMFRVEYEMHKPTVRHTEHQLPKLHTLQCVRKVAVHLGYGTYIGFRPVSTLMYNTSNTFYKCTATFRTQICRKCLRMKLEGFKTCIDARVHHFQHLL
jgi:hypothetical protein